MSSLFRPDKLVLRQCNSHRSSLFRHENLVLRQCNSPSRLMNPFQCYTVPQEIHNFPRCSHTDKCQLPARLPLAIYNMWKSSDQTLPINKTIVPIIMATSTQCILALTPEYHMFMSCITACDLDGMAHASIPHPNSSPKPP
jgi:hypothetical protein